MARYLDTGAGDALHSLGHWLDANLTQGIREFHAQFAYFTYSALNPYAVVLRTAVIAGFPVHIVLGSNEQSLTADDLRKALEITKNASNASLTVAAYTNAKFHPKTVQIVRSDGSASAIVGSGNFTHRGLGWNVEAAIALDTAEGDSALVVREVAEAIDRWHSMIGNGVFPIRNEADVKELLLAGIISLSPPPRQPSTSLTTRGNARAKIVLGSRASLWKPPVSTAPATMPTATIVTAPATRRRTRAAITPVMITTLTLPPQKWYKQMPKSDAQQVKPGTKPTHNLRLTKSVLRVEKATFFRNDLFGTMTWRPEIRDGNTYEVTDVEFIVTIHGRSYGKMTLTIDHALHRISNQSNIPTTLIWGPKLEHMLLAHSYTNEWVVIERDAAGDFSLTIQATRP